MEQTILQEPKNVQYNTAQYSTNHSQTRLFKLKYKNESLCVVLIQKRRNLHSGFAIKNYAQVDMK
jgi:hypothetical protein